MKKTKVKYELVAAALCLLGIIALVIFYFFTGFSVKQERMYLYDDTPDSVYQKLSEVASSHSMISLRTLLRYSDYDNNMLTGRYAIDPDDGVITVFRRLKNGQQSPIMLTIPEARTMPRLAALLAKRLMADSATIASALTDEHFCSELGYDTCTIAAMMVPNTYEVYWNTSIERLANRLSKEHDTFWGAERRRKAEAMGMTPNMRVLPPRIVGFIAEMFCIDVES